MQRAGYVGLAWFTAGLMKKGGEGKKGERGDPMGVWEDKEAR